MSARHGEAKSDSKSHHRSALSQSGDHKDHRDELASSSGSHAKQVYIVYRVIFIMPLSADSFCEGILFLGCLIVCSFVCLSGQILLPRYHMNGLNSFDKTNREYSLAPTDDLMI